MALVLRSRHRTLTKPPLTHLFSSSSSSSSDPNAPPPSSDPNGPPPPESQPPSSSSLSSYFGDVKASLKQQPPQPHRHNQPPPPYRRPDAPQNPSFPDRTSRAPTVDEIRKTLSEFRLRNAAPDPAEPNSPPPPPQISFQELYKRNVTARGDKTASNGQQQLSFRTIRETLRNARPNQNAGSGRKPDPFKLSDFTSTLRMKPNAPPNSTVYGGGSEALPLSIFRKGRKEEDEGWNPMKTQFLKVYNHAELGEKLRRLRPEEAARGGDGWFSLAELNERLVKLREMEEKETRPAVRGSGILFQDLRDSLVSMQITDEERVRKTAIQRLDMLGQLGRTPSFMMKPPKVELVEKYFHPDNMSSAEKLKIELAKVRDDFKMSESDCGSARVQVAQLTTKIKHLSSVLHKKDKHSLKGLQAMVQRRKKLLKYLRRTDWDSYCLVLSKLGLRDKPEFLCKHSLRYKTDN